MAQLNFVQRLQIANQKGYSNFDTRTRLTSLRMRRTNVLKIAVLNERDLHRHSRISAALKVGLVLARCNSAAISFSHCYCKI